jgi:hypothetical protein
MSEPGGRNELGIGQYILQFRIPIGLSLIAVTLFMAYWAVQVRIATRF